MYRIYDAWKDYALFIVEVFFAYCERTQHLPVIVTIGTLTIPFLAVDYFLPRWVALPIYAAIGLPLGWFICSMLWVFFTQEYNCQRRYK